MKSKNCPNGVRSPRSWPKIIRLEEELESSAKEGNSASIQISTNSPRKESKLAGRILELTLIRFN